MEESEVKRVKPKKGGEEVPRDPSMKAGARGGDKDAATPPSENEEPPIIQRYTE